jgi:ribosome-associated toxin RatA of RatAB toxin-antitoxin module
MSRVGCASSAAWLIAALLVLVAHPPAAASPAGEWQVLSNKDGLLIERRAKEGSLFYEVRATTLSSLAPAAIFETIWKQQEHPQFVPHLKRLDLLSEAGDERLSYEQVEVPLARDRDYTVRLQKRVDADVQRYEIAFATANEAGPPPDKHHIRVPSIRGRWMIEPGPDGKGSTVRYEVLSEPGGALPAWLVNKIQGEAVAKLVRAMLQRTRERASPK